MASRYCYPPIMPSSLPAIADGETLKITFNLSNLNFQDEIKHIQFIISYQNNNKSAVNNEQWLNNIIYIPWNAIKKENNNYYCNIIGENLKNGKWEAGYYYKVQARFGLSEFPGQSGDGFDYSQLAEWERNCQEMNLFTEWSTVTIVKVIPKPEIGIIGLNDQSNTVIGQQYITSNLGSFIGYYYNTDKTELIDTYAFKIYERNGEELTLIEDSGIKQHNSNDDFNIINYLNQQSNISSIDIFQSKQLLEVEKDYVIEYSITTKNLYTLTISYRISIYSDYTDPPSLSIACEPDEENAGIKIYLTTLNENTNGNFILVRTSLDSDYTIWEDLTYLYFENQVLNNELVFEDFLIESGNKYRYGIQQINSNLIRSELVYEPEEEAITCNYEYTFLYENGRQLKILYDDEVGSYKQTHLESKQDTMGSKYPFITRNGITCYHEFSIGGLISYHMDDAQLFINKNNIPYYQEPTTDLIYDNIHTEREFRKEVIDWLNNGNYKLFKSPTEGIYLISLLNSSFTPNNTLHRMIYSFSSSAYEIDDCNLNNLNTYKVYDIGQMQEVKPYTFLRQGQLAIIDNTNEQSIDLLNKIKEQQEEEVNENYSNIVTKITSLQIESLIEDDNNIELLINGKNIIVGKSGFYTLNEEIDINSLTLVRGNNVIINYVCEMQTIEKASMATFSINLLSSFIVNRTGQVQGLFNENNLDILKYIWDQELILLEQNDPDFSYSLKKVNKISIETESGTIIILNGKEILVGFTGIYNIIDFDISSLLFKNTSFAIIKYDINVLKEQRG